MESDEENQENQNLPNNQGIISESDLLDIYETQYNDIFSKILILSEEKFFALLQEQVLINLRIINKLSDLSLMSFFQELIYERYKTDKEKIKKDLDIMSKFFMRSGCVFTDSLDAFLWAIMPSYWEFKADL